MITSSNINNRVEPSATLGAGMLVNDLTMVLGTISDAKSYNQKPPIGPPTDRPTLSSEELEMLQKTAYGQLLGKDAAYSSIQLVEDDLRPVDIVMPESSTLENKCVWSIDGSSKTLDYTAFHMLLSRAALVEYRYSKSPMDAHHEVALIDRAGVCMVDGNIFNSDIHLFGNATKNLQNRDEVSWIEVMEDSEEPLIVSFNPETTDKKPSSHAQGWCIKFMQTLELMALSRLPDDKSGVVIRDGPLFTVSATMNDTLRALNEVLHWENKMLICSSKRISESTLFVEFLMNPQNEKHMEYYFPDQNISRTILDKLPADYILLPKILKPGQRTPFLEAIPRSRAPITSMNPDLTPICCYYMRKREPHAIIRLEFPRIYLNSNPDLLDWSLRCVAWQHELGTHVPHVQEFADRQCQLKSEIEIIQKITKSELWRKGLETLEVYE